MAYAIWGTGLTKSPDGFKTLDHEHQGRRSPETETSSQDKRLFETETSSYGYFPMLSFFWPAKRDEKVEWLMDQYAEAKGLYPKAKVSFVGHSNGTYLLAKALRKYPSCRFERVVFAGSVVRSDYPWDKFLGNGQVKGILNYVATSDWVVALFPKALETLNFQDLGSASHDGFQQVQPKYQVQYVQGGHSAALDEKNWDDIAEFVVSGNPPPPERFLEPQSHWIVWVGRFAPFIWLVILTGLVYLGYWIIAHPGWAEWFKTMLVISYLWCVYQVLTKV